jgi:tRNA modification GTPase
MGTVLAKRMSEDSSLQVVQLTPPGRGAIATVRVDGPAALCAVGASFQAQAGRPLGECPSDRPIFGRFGPPPGEEVVVWRRSDDAIEIHCHGGLAAVARLEQLLAERGARVAGWQDWIAAEHDDPIAAAALVALSEARTLRTAAILLDQYHGALRRAMGDIERLVREGQLPRAKQRAEALLARADLGLHLVRPWRVVLCGRPNVGKSSLMNALAGYDRAIVHYTPRTTRDVVSLRTAVDGWPVELCDTAGLHPGGDHLEQAAVKAAKKQLGRADLVVLVFDHSQPWSEVDVALHRASPDALVVHNKSDLPPAAGRREQGPCISALRGDGIDALADAIARRLIPHPPDPGEAVPFTPQQVERLRQFTT